MAVFTLDINNKRHEVEVPSGTSLLWVLREHLGLTGTKYGCGIAQCGSCGILCRCGTYLRIVKAIEMASNKQVSQT